jgi:flagellar motor switch protein FliN/FliY
MNIQAVSKVKVPIAVILGENELSLEELNQLGEGSLIELTSFAGEPVDLIAAGKKIGEGEVVIIDENFGLRVTKMLVG